MSVGAGWWRYDGQRLILELHVQPGAKRTEISGLHGERLKIRLAARALEGAANEALVAFLADLFQVRNRDVHIESGAASRQKRVSVRGARRAPDSLLGARS
jgi:uncharacterized protein (TIGR00251 family)